MRTPTVLGLIPARGGSKAIPGKNLALLRGKPLLAYSCDSARSSAHITRTIVSTDDLEIAAAARTFGVEVLDRPTALAGDEVAMVDVVRHALQSLSSQGWRCDAVVLLQPTSPLRKPAHIDAAIELLFKSGADAVVSIVEVPHAFTPASLMRLDGERLVAVAADAGSPVLRQQKPRLYARNGPAVLAVRSESALQRGLYEGDVRGIVMERECSIDIDDEMDLRLAEFWLSASAGHRVTAE